MPLPGTASCRLFGARFEMPQTWLIVGASRGIGFEFTKQLLARGDRVLAATGSSLSRHALGTWSDIVAAGSGRLQQFRCDMLREDTIDGMVDDLRACGVHHIDHVVLNAGVLKYPNRATDMSYADFALHLHTNTIGPVICAQRLLKSMISLGFITFISSDSGSTQRFLEMEDGFAAYSASKAALNQSLRHMAAELKRKGDDTVILALHPGEVKTDLANLNLEWEVEGQMMPEESVASCIKIIENRNQDDSGTFWTWENKRYPW
ncbi:NAD(P)-binding protein [Acrodontium crateriforme]|uniref:NAD(P)-binding protein n=1 Tax=Acrodontium crateriforme TaxID=150365 RepID=A0AAQ3M7W9_9PEZI|nr:NAD(P)-binding protein [Acrodontium crateriforme]